MKESRPHKPAFVFLVASLILISILLMFGFLTLRGWASATSLEFEGPSALRATPHGNLALVVGNQLFEIDSDNRLASQISLSELGLYGGGDVLFDSNGRFFMAQRDVPLDFSEKLLNRLFEVLPDMEAPLDGGIYRCSAGACSRFADISDVNSLHLSYSLATNPQTGDIYFSSSNAHSLLNFDAAGNRLATADQEFRFPNSLV